MEGNGSGLRLSKQERDRRWSLVREKMAKKGLDAIIVYADTRRHVPMRYLTDIMLTGATQGVLLFPVEGDPIVFTSLPLGARRAKVDKESWLAPENVEQAVDLAAALARRMIELRLDRTRVGIDSLKAWPVQEYRTIQGLCPDVELLEASRLLSEIRGPKSPEELTLIGEAIRVQELAQRTFLANLKSGAREEEVVGKVEDIVRANGFDQRLWLMLSSPEIPYPVIPGDTVIRRPNPVSFSSEIVRTRGYASQAVRTYCWEEPKGEFKRMWDLWAELRRLVPQELRPGRQITELGAKVDDMVVDWGFEADYLGHAVGLFMSDEPYISPGPRAQRYMEWVVKENEVYVFHPMIMLKGGGSPMAWGGDMYLVGENETKWMTPFLPGLPEMIP